MQCKKCDRDIFSFEVCQKKIWVHEHTGHVECRYFPDKSQEYPDRAEPA